MLGYLVTLFVLISSKQEDQMDLNNITIIPSNQYHAKIRSGYFTLVPFNQAFYYILCESQNANTPQNDPLVLYISSPRPGCSPLTAFTNQNGPFYFQNNDPTQMKINPNAWNKRANVLYLETPGGVGFSTAKDKYLAVNDTIFASDTLKALTIFFNKYKIYRGNDFYLAGSGYGGVYLPRLAEQILIYNEGVPQFRINLRGILLGNACIHPYQCVTSQSISRFSVQYLYNRGFIQESQFNQYQVLCSTSQSSTPCTTYQKNIFDNFTKTNINFYNIYSDCYSPPKNIKLQANLKCVDYFGAYSLFNNDKYRDALNVGTSVENLTWTPCSQSLKYTKQNKASYFSLPTLVGAGLNVFVYSGDLDASVPIAGTMFWFDKYRNEYKINIKKSWRPWISVSENASGMVWQLNGMTFASVKGEGHTGTNKRGEIQQIFNIFMGYKNWRYPKRYVQNIQ